MPDETNPSLSRELVGENLLARLQSQTLPTSCLALLNLIRSIKQRHYGNDWRLKPLHPVPEYWRTLFQSDEGSDESPPEPLSYEERCRSAFIKDFSLLSAAMKRSFDGLSISLPSLVHVDDSADTKEYTQATIGLLDACTKLLKNAARFRGEIPTCWPDSGVKWPVFAIRTLSDLGDFVELEHSSVQSVNVHPESFGRLHPNQLVMLQTIYLTCDEWGVGTPPRSTREIESSYQLERTLLHIKLWCRRHQHDRTFETKTSPVTLDGTDKRILRFLATDRHLLHKLADIEAAVEVSRKTVGERINRLIQANLVERPRGPRGGVRLTSDGQAVSSPPSH